MYMSGYCLLVSCCTTRLPSSSGLSKKQSRHYVVRQETNIRTKEQFKEVQLQLTEANINQECFALKMRSFCDMVAKMKYEIRDNACLSIQLYTLMDQHFLSLKKAVKTLRRKSCETNVRIKEQFAGIHQHLAEANMRQDYLALEIDNCRVCHQDGSKIRDNVWGTGMIKNGVCHDYVPCFQDVINEQKRAPRRQPYGSGYSSGFIRDIGKDRYQLV